MSSRNVYLSPDERQRATAMYRALNHAAAKIREGEVIGHEMQPARSWSRRALRSTMWKRAMRKRWNASRRADGPIRLLAAARLGKTRLIDNIAV